MIDCMHEVMLRYWHGSIRSGIMGGSIVLRLQQPPDSCKCLCTDELMIRLSEPGQHHSNNFISFSGLWSHASRQQA
uniref:Uncharacterized protein n=1 Tax=Oryza brachyantha TaxID=4533 RepID=J3N4K2_ORYBR